MVKELEVKFLKINKEMLSELSSMPDDALWQKIREIASSYGIALGEVAPSHSELEQVRSMCRGDAKLNMSQAVKLLNDYKRRRKT